MATMRDEPAEPSIALRYDAGGGDLPRMAAKGRGDVAAQIVSIATAQGVAVRRDQDLAPLLGRLQVGSPMRIAAFAAVAEILAHPCRANAQARETTSP